MSGNFLLVKNRSRAMSLKLTKKQTLILEFIADFQRENNFSPTFREIMSGVGLNSVSAVAEHIDNLITLGALKKVPGAARSLELIDYQHLETVSLFQSKLAYASTEDTAILLRAAEILGLDLSPPLVEDIKKSSELN